MLIILIIVIIIIHQTTEYLIQYQNGHIYIVTFVNNLLTYLQTMVIKSMSVTIRYTE